MHAMSISVARPGISARTQALLAWMGAGVAFVITEAIGIASAVYPAAWLGLFGRDPAMIEAGSAYLRLTGPFYGFFGLGMAIYFASQGAGRMLWPLLAALLRTGIVLGGGLLVSHWTD